MDSARRPERRSLNSRSLIASTLLGRHPATLSGKLLVALGELFGIAPGTTRVALTRMVQNGELVNGDGDYTLAGGLAERQKRQDASRANEPSQPQEWDGSWEQWIVRGEARSADQRADFRRAAAALKLAELRDGVWMRPANLAADRLPGEVEVLDTQADRFETRPEEPLVLAEALWDLGQWQSIAVELLAEIEADQIDEVPESFGLAAEVVRHLLYDPELPAGLLAMSWPGTGLRFAYNEHEGRLQTALAAFYRER